jgi:hypothetical protein
VDEITGEIMCLVKEPAVYKTVTKSVLKTPATTREVITPAKYKTVKKKVMTSPPQTKVIEIPEEYGTVKVTKLVEPAKKVSRTIPAEYQTVSRRVMVSPGHLEWQQILCQTNMTPKRITVIQRALRDAGYDPGPIDGMIGSGTMAAVNRYQADKELPVTKYLTLETLESLGVSP